MPLALANRGATRIIVTDLPDVSRDPSVFAERPGFYPLWTFAWRWLEVRFGSIPDHLEARLGVRVGRLSNTA